MPPMASSNTTLPHGVLHSAADKQKNSERRQTYVRLRPEVHKRLRFLAVERDVNMVDLIADAVDHYLRDQGDGA